MKRTRGFTIIEIAVVIMIIAVLVTLTIIGFTRVQANAHNDSSKSKSTIIAEALEKYYEKNGEYPTCAQMTGTSSTVTSSTLQGIDPDVLTRTGSSNGTNSINCTSPDTAGFTYNGNADLFTLSYKEETTGNVVTYNSRHKSPNESVTKPIIAIAFDGSNNVTATASTTPCKSGQTQFAFKYQVNGGAWTAYSAWSASSAASQPATAGYKYAYQVQAQCVGSATTVESDPSQTITQPVTMTSAPSVTASLSGATAVGTMTSIGCPAGTTAQNQIRYIQQTTSNNWTGWTGWSAVSTTSFTNNQSINEGWRGVFEGQAYCHGQFADSSIYTTPRPTVVRPFNQPAAPTWAGVSGWYSGDNASKPGLANYNTFCPTGAWTGSSTNKFYSIAWNGTRFDHTFPYNDWWYTGSSYTKSVEYYAWYTCYTDFASATSATSHITGMPVWP